MKNQNNEMTILTAQQKRAATIEAKRIAAEALELEAVTLLLTEEQRVRDAAFEALESAKISTVANKQKAFDTLEDVDSFKVSLDLARAAIESSGLAHANDNISAEKRRLTAINRINRCKRFAKMQALSTDALSIISANSEPLQIEKAAIYTDDKIIQIAKFLTGHTDVFGRGRNNSLMYLVRGIADKKPDVVTREFTINSLIKYGQPHESAETQATTSYKALCVLKCLTEVGKARYTVNSDSKLMQALLAEYAK